MGPWFGLLTLRLRPLQWEKTRDHFSELASTIIHMSWVIYHLIFRDISLKSQETFVYFSVMFHLIFSGFYLFNLFFVSCLFWAIQFIFVYLFVSLYSFIYSDIIIHLFIRILIGLVPCLTFFELFSYSLFIRLFIHHFFVLSFWAV